MVLYSCPRCGYSSNLKANLKRHFMKKKTCCVSLRNVSIQKCLISIEGNYSKVTPSDPQLTPSDPKNDPKMTPSDPKMTPSDPIDPQLTPSDPLFNFKWPVNKPKYITQKDLSWKNYTPIRKKDKKY